MKLKCKRLIAFLCGLLIGLSSCLCMVVSADSQSNGKDVLDNTRYSMFGWLPIGDILENLNNIANGEMPSNTVTGRPDILIDKFASRVAINAFKELQGKENGYVIKDIYSCICKRKIVYPINGYEELQYLYVYINKNVGATTQNFGNYTVAPNTMLLVRQTNFSGTMVYSIPIAENNISVSWGNGGDPCRIIIPNNSNFTMYTPEGAETFLVQSSISGQSMFVAIQNNNYNTIVDNHLQAVYDYNADHYYYNRYLPDGVMNGMEAFLGVGYDASLGIDQTTAWRNGTGSPYNDTRPWYMTTFFSNNDSGTGNPSYYSTNNNIDPIKPPAFILPQSNPFYSGKTIDNSTINNYNDYGMTINNNSLEIDPDILAGALGALIDPDFAGAIGGVFNAQPEIGLGFDTPLDLNLPDLVDDYIQSITIQVDVPEWTRPLVPAVTTYTHDFQDMVLPTTQTMPIDISDTVEGLNDIGYDLLDNMNLVPVFGILTLLGILIWCIF